MDVRECIFTNTPVQEILVENKKKIPRASHQATMLPELPLLLDGGVEYTIESNKQQPMTNSTQYKYCTIELHYYDTTRYDTNIVPVTTPHFLHSSGRNFETPASRFPDPTHHHSTTTINDFVADYQPEKEKGGGPISPPAVVVASPSPSSW